MLRKLTEIRVLKAIVDLSKSIERTDIDEIHFVNDTLFGLLNQIEIEKFTKIFYDYPGFRELYESPRAERHDLEALAKSPDNTLGYHYAKFMRETGFSLDWYPLMAEKSPLHFARNRQYETHDILHTITGFWGGSYNELGLQGFYVAQAAPNATPMTALAAAALNRLKTNEPEGNILLLDYLSEGYQMGKNAKKVIFRNWENDFDQDITTLRINLGIKPFTKRV